MTDDERVSGYLRTLSICHYVYAALAACFSLLGVFYIALGQLFGWLVEHAPKHEDAAREESAQIPSFMVEWMFGILGGAIVVGALSVAALCIVSARALAAHRGRTLSFVVAGIVCLTGMLGIALGVFTFVVLLMPEAQRLYEGAAAPPPTSPS